MLWGPLSCRQLSARVLVGTEGWTGAEASPGRRLSLSLCAGRKEKRAAGSSQCLFPYELVALGTHVAGEMVATTGYILACVPLPVVLVPRFRPGHLLL